MAKFRITINGPAVFKLRGEPFLSVSADNPLIIEQAEPMDLGAGVTVESGERNLAAELELAKQEKASASARAAAAEAERDALQSQIERLKGGAR